MFILSKQQLVVTFAHELVWKLSKRYQRCLFKEHKNILVSFILFHFGGSAERATVMVEATKKTFQKMKNIRQKFLFFTNNNLNKVDLKFFIKLKTSVRAFFKLREQIS